MTEPRTEPLAESRKVVLIGCERSGRVRDAFRRAGHNAWSCDIEPDFYGNSEFHLQTDVLLAITWKRWDLGIFFPPCQHLSAAGAARWPEKQADGRQQAAADFFLRLYDCEIPRVAVENPVGWMNTHFRKPDQVIEPWMWGDPFHKKTQLWLRGLPPLIPDVAVKPEQTRVVVSSSNKTRPGYVSGDLHEDRYGRKNRAYARSETFPGIAKAMASQWG